jgi:molybdopterin-binding protein
VNAVEISARNVFKGTVKSISYGQILAEMVIELPGGLEITSLITKSSADRMGLAVGKEVSTVIKASNVLVATE